MWRMVLFNVTRWPSVLVFLLAGGAAVCFAFVSVNLFSEAMASVRFLSTYKFEAIRFGAWVQVLELCLWGSLSLLCWLAFKICEGELVDRYQKWAKSQNEERKRAEVIVPVRVEKHRDAAITAKNAESANE